MTIEVTQISTFAGSLEEAAWRILRIGPELLKPQTGFGVARMNGLALAALMSRQSPRGRDTQYIIESSDTS